MIESILWVLFVLVCLLVCTVILLQDSKGGGLGEAFGATGQAAFGVDNKGIAKFTAYLAIVVVLLSVAITKMRSGGTVLDLADEPPPVTEGIDVSTAPAGNAPAGGDTGGSTGGQPAGDSGGDSKTDDPDGGN